MRIIGFIILMLFTQVPFAQKASVASFATIDQTALRLPEAEAQTTESISRYIQTHFTKEEEKVRAIFIWVAGNIRYDVANRYAVNFYEKKEDKIQKSLQNRKGICENYAALFNDLCAKTGIPSYVIEGYTRQNGVIQALPHAWCAAKISNSWSFYDPTWGAGYISNEKFIPKISNEFFQVTPEKNVVSHMPFDYLWQFLSYPVTASEFQEGKTQVHKSKPFFSYTDSLATYESKDKADQLRAAIDRIERNGVNNALLFDRLRYLKMELETDRHNKTADFYNSAVALYNEAISSLNAFITYRNKQFLPAKPDAEIQEMTALTSRKLKEAQEKLQQAHATDENTRSSVAQLQKAIENATAQVQEHDAWLKTYMSKSKLGRRSMFYKVNFLGVPLN